MSERSRSSGQALAIMALSVAVVLAATAVVIDGGNAFAQQRGAQNAADSAALAGAVVIAEKMGDASRDDDDVVDAMSDAFADNGSSMGPSYYIDFYGNIVGTVGRMQQVKDQPMLVRAFVQALQWQPALRDRLRLVLVGDGPLKAQCEALLADAGMTALAWLPGERQDVADVMRGLDCFALPSLAEGISNTILEAMASGLPVVATDVGGFALSRDGRWLAYTQRRNDRWHLRLQSADPARLERWEVAIEGDGRVAMRWRPDGSAILFLRPDSLYAVPVATGEGLVRPLGVLATPGHPEEFAVMASTPPAIHRYGRSMAGRVQALAKVVEETYGGRAERLWTEASSGADLFARVVALPGFGKQKAQIFVALLAKQLGVRPNGWEQAVGDYALDGYRSVADVTDGGSLQKVRDFKKAHKAEKAAAAGG